MPHPIDTHVGQQIKARRNRQSMSQAVLAAHLGITFQQIQKYENATNRVSASKLFMISRALDTNIGYFFKGAPE